MLAKVFKTAAELKMLEHEYRALVELLYRIEDGTISMDEIRMDSFHCGTQHCLAGWANAIDRTAFPEIDPAHFWCGMARPRELAERLPYELKCLFAMSGSFRVPKSEKAVAQLRQFLETGSAH